MKTTTVIVWLSAIALVGFALYFKGDVRAGGRFRGGEFFIQASDKQK